MTRQILTTLFLILVTGCGPNRWTKINNEILLPPTVEIRDDSDPGKINVGILLHGKELENKESPPAYWFDRHPRELSITRDGGGPFLYLKKTLPVDIFLYKGGKSVVGELRYYPLKKSIKHFDPGVGIGGLYDLNGKVWPLLTFYFNIPFENTNLYIAPRLFKTPVSTQLEWRDGNSYYFEEGKWKGEGWNVTTGINHNFSRRMGAQLEWTTFNIQKGLKDVRWPEEDTRPHLVEMDLVDSSLSISVYLRY